jgi:hypothetical protein
LVDASSASDTPHCRINIARSDWNNDMESTRTHLATLIKSAPRTRPYVAAETVAVGS